MNHNLPIPAARSGEVLGARWNEIDLDARLWTVHAAGDVAQQAKSVQSRIDLLPLDG